MESSWGAMAAVNGDLTAPGLVLPCATWSIGMVGLMLKWVVSLTMEGKW